MIEKPFSFSCFIALIILLEGFVSISTEILTIRQLLPVAGGSVVVTSLIIGIFLLFLALGYQQGANKNSNLKYILWKNFFIAAIWLGVGLSYFFISLFFYYVEKLTGAHVVYPLIGYLLIIVAPCIYLLGQTLPITMNMVKQNLPAGVIGGKTLGLSTLGSFLGATITSVIFMYYFGVAWTICINVALLLLMTLILTEKNALLNAVTCALTMSFIYVINISTEKNFFVLTTNFANYQVLNNANKPGKSLIINDAHSSFLGENKQGFSYIELIKKFLFHDVKLRNADILVLGAGGFSLSAENKYNNKFTYVDIDPQLHKAVVPQFIAKIQDELVVDDARHFLHASKEKYHVIVVDTYSTLRSIPAHLLTQEFMLSIQQRLRSDGFAIFNIIANPFLIDAYSKHVDNTIRGVFKNCMAAPQTYKDAPTNIIYACHNGQNQADKLVYSDNLNNSTVESFNW